MSEEDAFLVDILAQPHDPTARLVYADWLEERGDARADWVRRGIELALPPDGQGEAWAKELNYRSDLQKALPGYREYLGLPLDWDRLTTVFLYRLAEAIAYSESRFRPFQRRDEAGARVGPLGALFGMDTDTCHGFSRRLAVARSDVLSQAGQSPTRPAESLAGGRLLVCAYHRRLGEEESAHMRRSSDEFFDRLGSPPLGAWVARVKEDEAPAGQAQFFHYVAVWVPPALLVGVGRAMSLQPSGIESRALCWSKRVTASLLRRCRERGLTL